MSPGRKDLVAVESYSGLPSAAGQQWRQQPRSTTSETLATMAPKERVRGKALVLKSSRQETELQRSQTKCEWWLP